MLMSFKIALLEAYKAVPKKDREPKNQKTETDEKKHYLNVSLAPFDTTPHRSIHHIVQKSEYSTRVSYEYSCSMDDVCTKKQKECCRKMKELWTRLADILNWDGQHQNLDIAIAHFIEPRSTGLAEKLDNHLDQFVNLSDDKKQSAESWYLVEALRTARMYDLWDSLFYSKEDKAKKTTDKDNIEQQLVLTMPTVSELLLADPMIIRVHAYLHNPDSQIADFAAFFDWSAILASSADETLRSASNLCSKIEDEIAKKENQGKETKEVVLIVLRSLFLPIDNKNPKTETGTERKRKREQKSEDIEGQK